LWALLSALHPAQHNVSHPSSYYNFYNLIEIPFQKDTEIQFPVQLEQIPKIERLNDLKINVFILTKCSKNKENLSIKDFTLEPLYLSKNGHEDDYASDQVIDLLLYQGIFFTRCFK
jgi:hypothetical protein